MAHATNKSLLLFPRNKHHFTSDRNCNSSWIGKEAKRAERIKERRQQQQQQQKQPRNWSARGKPPWKMFWATSDRQFSMAKQQRVVFCYSFFLFLSFLSFTSCVPSYTHIIFHNTRNEHNVCFENWYRASQHNPLRCSVECLMLFASVELNQCFITRSTAAFDFNRNKLKNTNNYCYYSQTASATELTQFKPPPTTGLCQTNKNTRARFFPPEKLFRSVFNPLFSFSFFHYLTFQFSEPF